IDTESEAVAVANGRFSPAIDPLLHLRMPIGEGETAGAVVIAGGVIEDVGLGGIVQVSHPDPERTVVDAVRMLIHEDVNLAGGTDIVVLALHEELEARLGHSVVEPLSTRRIPDSHTHRHAAHARKSPPRALDGAAISRALV